MQRRFGAGSERDEAVDTLENTQSIQCGHHSTRHSLTARNPNRGERIIRQNNLIFPATHIALVAQCYACAMYAWG